MSFWTYIEGKIIFEKKPTEEQLGTIIVFDDEDWKKIRQKPGVKLPLGSEGSMRYWALDSAPYYVVFGGSLRDYEEDEDMIKYFQDLCKNNKIISGKIEIDGQQQFIMEYKKKVNRFKITFHEDLEDVCSDILCHNDLHIRIREGAISFLEKEWDDSKVAAKQKKSIIECLKRYMIKEEFLQIFKK